MHIAHDGGVVVGNTTLVALGYLKPNYEVIARAFNPLASGLQQIIARAYNPLASGLQHRGELPHQVCPHLMEDECVVGFKEHSVPQWNIVGLQPL